MNRYRYGFNGKENDNEVKGEGAQQDYGMRIYDPRLAKFLSVDPISATYPYLTPYQFAENSPILFIDLDGLEKALPWYLRENKYGGKPVLTLGLGNLKTYTRLDHTNYPTRMKTGAFSLNLLGAAWNGIANTWNDALDGKSGAAMLGETMNTLQEMKVSDLKNAETWENIGGGILTAYATRRFTKAWGAKTVRTPFVEVNDIALGVNEPVPQGPPRSLSRFAEQVNALEHNQWGEVLGDVAKGGDFTEIFKNVLNHTVEKGGKIKFDLTTFKIDDAKKVKGLPIGEAGYTNWEFNEIMGNSKYLNATEFYQNGSKVNSADVVKQYSSN